MTDALLELAHREYTIGDYKNAEAHCKQVTFRLIMTLQLYVTSPPIPRLFLREKAVLFNRFLYF